MIKTQIQLPDELYKTAKAIAAQREWSLAEVIRRGIEHMAIAYPLHEGTENWALPILSSEQFVSHFDNLDFKAISEEQEMRSFK